MVESLSGQVLPVMRGARVSSLKSVTQFIHHELCYYSVFLTQGVSLRYDDTAEILSSTEEVVAQVCRTF